MSSPIDLIKSGIVQGDWQKVCDGFAGISGLRLPVPVTQAAALVVPEGGFPNQFYETLGRAVLSAVIRIPGDGLVCGRIGKDEDPGLDLLEVTTSEDRDEDDDDEDEDDEDEDDEEEEEADDDDDDDDDDDEPPPPPAAAEPESALAPPPATAPVTAAPEDPYAQFKVVQGTPKNADGKRACRVEPFTPAKPTWKDDRTIAGKEHLRETKKMNRKKRPEPRRPRVNKVRVECVKCQGTEEVEPILAPKALDKTDRSSYVCNRCIARGKRN